MNSGFTTNDPDNPIGRYGIRNYFSLGQGPRRGSVADQAFGAGWWELDEIFKFYLGQFVMVTGTAGHGKSTFLLNIVAKLAREKGIKSFLFAPENEFYLYDKMEKIWNHAPTFERFCYEQCFVQFATTHDYEEGPQTLNWVLSRAAEAVENDKIELVIIDPWNELERAKARDMLLTDYIGQCLMYLKQFARAMNVAVVLVAHPTKDAAKDAAKGERAITLIDIEGSMNWFNKCDNGLIVVREDGDKCKITSAKVREVGAGRRGSCYFTVDPETGIFTPTYGAVDVSGQPQNLAEYRRNRQSNRSDAD
jgi:archaellum biogenesis ATPase FlaH